MKKIIFYTAALLFALACSDSENTEPGEKPLVSSTVEVVEYTPAPGQFINKGYDASTPAEAVRWAQDRLEDGAFVSLGAFGGYMVVKLPFTVPNWEGYDFGISGNPIPTQNEPGIVWVSRDERGDGTPGLWYELKGSETGRRGYSVTYYKPEEAGDIRWTDSDGEEGVVAYVPASHTQNYYPAWCDNDGSYTLSGTLLPVNADESGTLERNDPFDWGYVDNLGGDAFNNANGRYLYNRFYISDAMDGNGAPVKLDGIDFIKVQGAVQFNMGATGEISTEVTGFWLPDQTR